MINKNMTYDFDDFLIEPAVLTTIKSRKEVNSRYNDGLLPLMTAPMDTVLDSTNADLFYKNGIMPVIPRISNPDNNYFSSTYFLSYSLEEVENIFLTNTPEINQPIKVLIDIANGHMESLLKVSKSLKLKYEDKMILMIGNIANPTTIDYFCKIGVDYIRLGIGNGGGCLTSENVGVGSSMVDLINESYKLRLKFYGDKTKLIADGGFKKYADVIKALALGADYVMLGSILNKSLESIGKTTKIDSLGNYIEVDQFSDVAKKMFLSDTPLYKLFRGMSTKDVQKSLGKTDLKTSEGVVKTNKVEYTLNGWVENFEDYLKSAMSYTNKRTLDEFKGKVMLNLISENVFKRFNK